VVSKPHLTPRYGVASFFEMLKYYRVCCAFSSTRALSLDAIWGFETTSRSYLKIVFWPNPQGVCSPQMGWANPLLAGEPLEYLSALQRRESLRLI